MLARLGREATVALQLLGLHSMAQQTNAKQHLEPYFSARIGNQTSGARVFSHISNYGFTCPSPYNAITCTIPGQYRIMARQLVQTDGNQIYWQILKNGSVVGYAYPPPNLQQDVWTWTTTELAAGDVITINATATITQSWTGPHSNLTIMKVA